MLLAMALFGSPALARQAVIDKGMPLSDALQNLQARGLKIVFSSAIVSPDLRVKVEPKGTTARQQLGELLAPHGLEVREGPGQTLQIVRAETSKRARREARGSVEGRVVDAWTAAPVPNVIVGVEGHDAETQTDAAGQFVLKQIAIGRQTVTALADGYLPIRRAVSIEEAPARIALRLFPEAQTHREFISVSDAAPHRQDRGVASEMSLDRSDVASLTGHAAEDPLGAFHSFPGVTATDDFRSDLVVRGSPFRHVDLVIDGVSTHWLRHSAADRGVTGSLLMMSSIVVESATLRSGAFPRRHGDRLGPELDLSLREGSRSEFVLRGAIGGSHAVLAAEGPLGAAGSTGSARGSWLLSARQSVLEWPPERPASSRTPFGFSDGLAKAVFDVRPTQQVALVALGGISTVDGEEEAPVPHQLADGTNRASAISVSWRSTFGPALVVKQQASLVTQRFWNREQSGQHTDGGSNRAIAYRAAMSRPLGKGLLDAGGLVERIDVRQNHGPPQAMPIDGFSWQRSAYAHVAWPVTASLTLSPGGRLTSSTRVRTPSISPWLLGEWTFRPDWTLIGSAGASRQLPELSYVLGETGSPDLRPEQAAHFELGIEQQLGAGIRWQATIFQRRESDVIRAPHVYPRLVAGTLVAPDAGERYTNGLRATARGVELLVQRRNPVGLSGWATYAYGRTQQTDPISAEPFWADFDQRHTLNLFATYRFPTRTSVTGTFRAGSNFPIAGYFAESSGRLLVGNVRNAVRLPPYARLDLRADHRLRYFKGMFTLFVEALNALNRANVSLANGSVDPISAEARGFTDTLLRRRISGGVVFEF